MATRGPLGSSPASDAPPQIVSMLRKFALYFMIWDYSELGGGGVLFPRVPLFRIPESSVLHGELPGWTLTHHFEQWLSLESQSPL